MSQENEKKNTLCIGGGDLYTNWTIRGFKSLGSHDSSCIKKEWGDLTKTDARNFVRDNGRVQFLFVDYGSLKWLPIEQKKQKALIDFLCSIIDTENFTFLFYNNNRSGKLHIFPGGVTQYFTIDYILHLFSPMLDKIRREKYFFEINVKNYQQCNCCLLTQDSESHIIISTFDKIGQYKNYVDPVAFDFYDKEKINIIRKYVTNHLNNDKAFNRFLGFSSISGYGNTHKDKILDNEFIFPYTDTVYYVYDKLKEMLEEMNTIKIQSKLQRKLKSDSRRKAKRSDSGKRRVKKNKT